MSWHIGSIVSMDPDVVWMVLVQDGACMEEVAVRQADTAPQNGIHGVEVVWQWGEHTTIKSLGPWSGSVPTPAEEARR